MRAIFISYRRSDTADAAGRIYDRLLSAFGEGAVFKDVDTLPIGEDFGQHIITSLEQCRVVLVLIGPAWLSEVDGRSRLHQESDWVRIEVETALNLAGLQIVPVLLNGAEMPNRADLPASLHPITALNAATVRRDPDFHRDMERLIKGLKDGALTGTVIVEQAPATPASLEWAKLKDSLDQVELRIFAEQFPNTSEGLDARRRLLQLEREQQLLEEQAAVERAERLDKLRRERNVVLASELRREIAAALQQQSDLDANFEKMPEIQRFKNRAENIERKSATLGKGLDALRIGGCWVLSAAMLWAWVYIALPMMVGWSLWAIIPAGAVCLLIAGGVVNSFNDWAESNLTPHDWEETEIKQLEAEASRSGTFKEMEAQYTRLKERISALESELARLEGETG